MESQAARLMGDMAEAGDAPFGGEVALASRMYWWHDKYRPRKPKYFNRVHTGYEWNKYNQTHYDHDNPPPKVGLADMLSMPASHSICFRTSAQHLAECGSCAAEGLELAADSFGPMPER